MAQKVVLIADPGIDTAFAVALALLEPKFEVLALCASPGNVSSLQATTNVHTLITQLDPARWPRLGAAPHVTFDIDGTRLHGADGLGNANFPAISLHAPMASDRLLTEIVHQFPHDVTVICLGPMSVLAAAFSRDPTLPQKIDRVICIGGAWREPGNSTAVAEFHLFCDPVSARKVMHSEANITLIPLDVTRKLIFSPSDLLELPAPESKTSQFLRRIVPFGIRASSNLYGIEGFHMKDILGVIALACPKLLTLQPFHVDVETVGELTRGMIVVDSRPTPVAPPNVDLATGVDAVGVRDYIVETLRRADESSTA